MRTSFRKPSVFFSLLISFIIMLTLPMFNTIYSSRNASHLVEKYSLDTARFMLTQSSLAFERFLEIADHTVYTLNADTEIQSASYLTRPAYGSKSINRFVKLLNRINPNIASEQIQSKLFLFLKKPDAIVQRESVAYNIENFYSFFLAYEGLSYEDWRAEMLDIPHDRYLVPVHKLTAADFFRNKNNEYITYVHSYTLATYVNLITADSVRNIMSGAIISDNGTAFILNREYEIVIQTGDASLANSLNFTDIINNPEQHIQLDNDTRMIALCRTSADGNLHFISLNLLDETMQDMQQFQKVTYTSIFTVLFIGLLIAVLFSRSHTKPINEVISLLNRRFETGGKVGSVRYQSLKDNITNLLKDNAKLAKTYQNQMVISKNLFFTQLLVGTIKDKDELERYLDYFNLNLRNGKYIVFIMNCRTNLNLESADEGSILTMDILRLRIDEVLAENEKHNGYSHILSGGDIAVILCLNSISGADVYFEDILIKLQKVLMEDMGLPFSIGVGTAYVDLIDVCYSFSEAKLAVEYSAKLGKNEIIQYSEIDNIHKSGYYYPLDMEQKLISLTKMGKKEKVLLCLNQIYRENFTVRTLDSENRVNLQFEIRSTIHRIMNELGNNHEILNIRKLTPMGGGGVDQDDDMFELFPNCFEQICDLVNSGKKSHNQKMIDDILTEIDMNYMDSCLSVDQLADKFDISQNYFSRFFKEQTGEVFSTWLERVRINKACELLKNTDESVENISAAVGYNSAYSFRRAFKKIQNMLPTDFRDG